MVVPTRQLPLTCAVQLAAMLRREGAEGIGKGCQELSANSLDGLIDEHYRTHDHSVSITDVQRHSDKVHVLLVQ